LIRYLRNFGCKAWINPCNNPLGALNYCKKCCNIVEIGIFDNVKYKGKRTDLEEIYKNCEKEGYMTTFKKFPVRVGRCYKSVKEFESIILKKTPPQDKKTIWICGESGCGKSLLSRYIGNEKLRESNMVDKEPNFYTDNPSHWFAGSNPFMFSEKFGSKWFDSKLVIITSITSLYEVWGSLDDKIRIRHNFWELGRRIDLQLRTILHMFQQTDENKEFLH
jgi:hypothetical protein